MSRTDRDRRHRPPSEKRCPEAANGGCGYCVTGSAKRPARRNIRHAIRTILRRREEP